MKQATEEASEQVDRLYSTKPVRVVLGSRQYLIPANYFGPKEKDGPDTFDAGSGGYFGFVLFLPDYAGYTKQNWRDPFDRRKITIRSVGMVDKDRIVTYSDGRRGRVGPADYGDPKAVFQRMRKLGMIEAKPSIHLYGLDGYRGGLNVVWAGTRSNGEFIFFESNLAPGDPPKAGLVNPICDVRYYSSKEDLRITYQYSVDQLSKWREIDNAIWKRLHTWQVK